MPWYTVTGTGESTGRPRRRRYYAADEAAARQQASNDGTRVDTLEPDPPRLATERQAAYAHDLGIALPTDATIEEASDLIACATSGPIAPELAAYLSACGHRVPAAQETAARLSTRHELVQWYLLNVARHLWRADWQHPRAPELPFDLAALADAFLAEQNAAKSFDRVAPEPGATWPRLIDIFHGGTDIASVNTTAYRHACALLDQRQPHQPPPRRRPVRATPAAAPTNRRMSTCRHCAAPISRAAESCPHCGGSLPGLGLKMRLLGALVAAAPAALVLYLVLHWAGLI